MTLENASRPVPLTAEARALTRRSLVPIAGVLLGGALITGGGSAAHAGGTTMRRPSAMFYGGSEARAGAWLLIELTGLVKGAKVTYQWKVGGVAIKGATSDSLTVPRGTVGNQLSVALTISAAGYETLRYEQSAGTIAQGPLESSTPTIVGTPTVGQKLTAKPGTWTSGAKLAYEWHLDYGPGDVRPIKGATTSTLTVTSSMVGKGLYVVVKGTKSGYDEIWRMSGYVYPKNASTGKTLSAPTPTISGTARVGSKLTAKAGSWTSGTKLAYQWKANGAAIKGATGSTFTLGSAQIGKTITVTVTGTKSGYKPTAKTSKATAKVAAKTLSGATPTISGTLRVGSTVTAHKGSWTSGTTRTYQWYANGVALKGATKYTLVIPSSALGKQLSVKVTGRKAGYTTLSRTSKETAKIAARKR